MKPTFIQGDSQDFVYGICGLVKAHEDGKNFIKLLEKNQHIELTKVEKEMLEQTKELNLRLWRRLVDIILLNNESDFNIRIKQKDN